MKSLLAVGLVTVFSACALAQHQHRGGGAPPLLGPSYPGVGGALPIVGGGVPVVNPFSGSVPFGQRLAATISGFPPYTGAPSGSGRHRRQGYVGFGGYPMLYPTFGPLGTAYDQSAYNQPAYDQPAGPPPDQPANPPVAINQDFGPESQPGEGRPTIQSYSAPSAPRPEPSEDQPLFFIGLTDNSVYTAVAYWVEGGTLNYITPQGRHNQVSLSLIDRETTGRLNRGSKFQLHLPGA